MSWPATISRGNASYEPYKKPSPSAPSTFYKAVEAIENGEPLSQVAQKLLSELQTTERLHLLDGDVPFYPGLRQILCDRYNRVPFVHGEISRLGIPGVRFTDGPRGVVMGASTAFPVAIARGATWDLSLERRVGHAIGLEAKAQGANYFAGVCVNLPRHPAWGRIQETYGEDPLILGEFGLALTQGVQNHVMACVKHFALNSMENARFRVDVSVDEDVLHEVYLPHFRRIIEGGVASVMSSYNSVNGEFAGQNEQLLTDILRNQWGFDGFVISDFIFGLRDASLSLQNGLDVEAPFSQQRAMHLEKALQVGELDCSYVDQACLRILRKQLQFHIQTKASAPNMSVVFSDGHQALAREVAARSMVLLKNEKVQGKPLLPLEATKLSKIALVGRLANTANTGDKGSSQVFSPQVVTPFDGLRAALPNCEIILEDTGSVEKAREAAVDADIVICIVGYDSHDEGEYVVPSLQSDPCLLDLLPPTRTKGDKDTLEMVKGTSSDSKLDTGLEVGAGGDRKSLRLRCEDIDMIAAVTAANPRTVVSVITAGAVVMEEWKAKVPALLFSWYSGSAGGHGLADVLFGRVDASGRLPFSIPKDETSLPFFDIEASKIKYDRWFGQALLDKLGIEAAFPLGFGLSYTNFQISGLHIKEMDSGPIRDTLTVGLTVANTGPRQGRYVVQIYGRPGYANFPTRVLLGFEPIDLCAGESKLLKVIASLRPLQRWINGHFMLPCKEVTVEAAAFAGDSSALQVRLHL